MKYPPVTLVLPIRNEAAFIEEGLNAALRQTYPADKLEILVVDGMSDDGTRDIVRQVVQAETICDVRLIDNVYRYAPHAFNIGIQEARGEIIILIGGHSKIPSDYVSLCVDALRSSRADCVGGVLETVGETPIARAIALAQSSPFGVGGVAFRTGKDRGTFVDTVAFGAYRKNVFRKVGLFDQELIRNQDDEFNFRLTQAGGRIWLDPSIRSVYYSRASLSRLWRQYFQYGFYKVRVMQKRSGLAAWRHVIPAIFILALIGSFVVAMLTTSWVWTTIVFTPYVAANVVASAIVARNDWRLGPLLPPAFATLHFAYGCGFLWGIWKLRDKWGDREVRSPKLIETSVTAQNAEA